MGISIETFAFANFKTEPGSLSCCSDTRGKKITPVEDNELRTTTTTTTNEGLDNFILCEFSSILKTLLKNVYLY